MRVIIPLKNFEYAKQRLASFLQPTQRHQLLLAMAQDLVEVVSNHPDIEQVTLVSDEPKIFELANDYQVEYLCEKALRSAGLNEVLLAALNQPTTHSHDHVMILLGDLPLLNHRELTELIHRYRSQKEASMLIAPDRHGKGTNCLIFSNKTRPTLGFGSGSCIWHEKEAKRLNINYLKVYLRGTRFDMDLPQDLYYLLSPINRYRAEKSRRYLRNIFRAKAIQRDQSMPSEKLVNLPPFTIS